MDDLLPVLSAWLEDGPQLNDVLRAALEGKVAYLSLEEPPFEQTTHILEVHVVGAEQPFVLLADPVGFATRGLFPLQVRPLDEAQREKLAATLTIEIGESAEQQAERLSSLPPPSTREEIARAVSKPPADPLLGKAIGSGKFKLEQLLGSGAAGRVYRAVHRDLKKAVAVKVLHPFYQADPSFAERFQGEALAASRIDHPNVMRILDFGQEPDGMLYIVMEYLEGRDLAKVIEVEGSLSIERVVAIGAQICAGLSVAHDAGIVHRDIKPENVLLIAGIDDEGHPTEVAKVCDFGIAQTQASGQGSVSGTPEYMAPEVWLAGEVDARADLYAIGVSLFEMASGRVPITGTSVEEIMHRTLLQDVPPVSDFNPNVDRRLEPILAKCLAKEPNDRYASARDLRADLRAIVEPAAGEARLKRRRELLEQSHLTPLEDAESGFAEFFVALSSAVMRTGYYEKGHKESATALARLAASVDNILKNRGEISFARRDVGEEVFLTVMSAAGEVKELNKLLSASVFELHAQKFGEVFLRRSVVSLALRDGVDEEELLDLVDLLSGPEIPADQLRERFLKRGFTCVSVLFASDLLGRRRRLPWQVDLCVSRLARDLEALPLIRGMDAEQRRILRTQVAGDVVRPLNKPDQLRALLDNADLISGAIGHLDEMAAVDISQVIIDACSLRNATALARHLLEVSAADGGADVWGVATGHAAFADPKEHLKLIAKRFVRERAAESDVILRQLYDKSFLALPDLPDDLRLWITAESHASTLTTSPEEIIGRLDAIVDPDLYDRHVPIFELVIRVLGRRNEVGALLRLYELFKAHVADARRHVRIRQRAASIAHVLEDDEVLSNVARTLLGDSITGREGAQRLLAGVGAKAATPLVEARLQNPGTDAAVRARFVATFREMGAPGVATLTATLNGLAPDADPLLVEDLLRAMPEVADETAGRVVERFIDHTAPGVRRASATALPALAGTASREALIRLFEGIDDGTRLGALAGLRRINAIDARIVTTIAKILGPPGEGGEELRAACAAALVGVPAELRPTAIELLAKIVRVPRKSFVGLLKDAVATKRESEMVLVTSARALVKLGGGPEREIVRERALTTAGVLRKQLEALVASSG